MKKSWTQRKWTLAQYTRFTLPITCQLISEAINCSAVRIKSNTRNAFPNLQSQILEQRWELKKPQEYPFLDTSLQVYSMWTGGIIMIILIIHTGIKLLKSTHCGRNTEEIISINHAIPSAPTDPNANRDQPQLTSTPTRTSRTVSELTQMNSRMEFLAKYKASSINQVVNLYDLMGSNLEESTQNILDSYLEETMEGNDDHIADLFSNNHDGTISGELPSVHANREARLC